MSQDSSRAFEADAGRFASTHWSVVLAAADRNDRRSREALAKLCATYWYPLYAFVRRQGFGPEDAEDLTQGFFAHLLEHEALATVDRAKGKFRSFLLASLRPFLANEWDHDQAQKRSRASHQISRGNQLSGFVFCRIVFSVRDCSRGVR
jgi:RNA polymerase sigma-70 factor (ECF subfamily)